MKKKSRKVKLSNQQGSVLNVTLMIFIIVVMSLLMTSRIYADLFAFHKDEVKLNEQRQIQIYLKRYFRETMDTDLLLSDDFTVNNTRIHYTVDDMWSYYLIDCDISDNQNRYRFEMHISTKDLSVIGFKYLS